MNTNKQVTTNSDDYDLKFCGQEFSATGSFLYITSGELEAVIAESLSQYFRNLHSVSISLNDGSDPALPSDVGKGEFYFNLHFKPGTPVSPNAPVDNLIEIGAKSSNDGPKASSTAKDAANASLANKIFAITGNDGSKIENHYTITKPTKELCARFLPYGMNTNWKDPRRVREYEDPTVWRGPNKELYVAVVGLSLGLFVNELYNGTGNNDYDYQLMHARNVTPSQNGYKTQYLICINRMSRAKANEVARICNYVNTDAYFGTRVR